MGKTVDAAWTIESVLTSTIHIYLFANTALGVPRWHDQLFQGAAGITRDAHPDPRPGRRWQNDDTVSLASGRGGHDDTDDRLQRGTGDVQKPQVPSVGSGRPDKHSAVLAMLLQQHGCDHLRGGLGGSGSNRHFKGRAALHAARKFGL